MRFLTLIVFILISVCFKAQETEDKSGYWVKPSYIKCLKDSLPCDCWRWDVPDLLCLNMDSVKDNTVNSGNTLNNDYIINYSVGKTTQFDVVTLVSRSFGDKDSIQFHVEIKKDTLYYTNLKTKNVTNYIREYDRYIFVSNICLNSLNALLKQNNHKSLEKITGSDSLECDCDIQFGINRIHNGKEIWALELKDKELLIYNWTYPKERGSTAKRKLFKRIKLTKK